MKKLYVPTLIVGSGFSGRTVANWLDKSEYLIVERGEYRGYHEMQANYRSGYDPARKPWQNSRKAYESGLEFNKTYDLSGQPDCFSQFEFIGGGTSNRWDGYAVRIPRHIFSSGDYLKWPFTYEEMMPWYALAERQLNVCGDHDRNNTGQPPTRIDSGDYFRDKFRSFGLSVILRNQAKNPLRTVGRQGRCIGAGTCEFCPADAKIRPEHIYADQRIKYATLVETIEFQGARARYAHCRTEKSRFLIEFDRIVLAAHAVESARLLAGAPNLPREVNRKNIGRYFQDHAYCELQVLLPVHVDLKRMPFKSNMQIRELTAMVNGLDVLATIEHGELWLESWVALKNPKPKSFIKIQEFAERSANIMLSFEMPPEHHRWVDFSGTTPKINDLSWSEIVRDYDNTADYLIDKLKRHDVHILARRNHYRHIFGQHYLVGTLNMSDGPEAVVARGFRLIGCDNLYVAGTALIPRLGAQAPTLTAVALSNMLGQQLSSS